MKDVKYTCKTRLVPGAKDGEAAVVIRLSDDTLHHCVRDPDFPFTNHHFMTGPIADKLYAYENLGYSPEEMEKIIRELRFRRMAINSTYGKLSIPREVIERYIDTDSIKVMSDYVAGNLNATKMAYMDWVQRKEEKRRLEIKKVIFHDPATIVYWADGSKTVVKATNEAYDPEKGLAMAISKRALGDKGNYYEVFKKQLKEGKK